MPDLQLYVWGKATINGAAGMLFAVAASPLGARGDILNRFATEEVAGLNADPAVFELPGTVFVPCSNTLAFVSSEPVRAPQQPALRPGMSIECERCGECHQLEGTPQMMHMQCRGQKRLAAIDGQRV